MDHENQHQTPELPQPATAETSFKAVLEAAPTSRSSCRRRGNPNSSAMRWIFTGGRACAPAGRWRSFLSFSFFCHGRGYAFVSLHIIGKRNEINAFTAFWGVERLSALLGAAALVALIERRRSLLGV